MSRRQPGRWVCRALAAACLVSAACVGATASAFARDTRDTAVLTLVIKRVSVAEGDMMVALFRNADAWRSNAFERGVDAPVTTPDTTVTFADLEPGEYAVKVYHDEDGDGALNTGLFGVPSEPYGFSNNAQGRFGPASYDDARFTLEAGDTRHVIRLID